MDAPSDGGSLPRAFFAPGSSSFADFLASHQPDLLPGRRLDLPAGMSGHIDAPHGTTIVAVRPHPRRRHRRRPPRHDGQRHRPARHREGLPGRRVLRRRHRRHRRHRRSSWCGSSRSSSSTTRRSKAPRLSLEGKANRLSLLIRNNLAMAMQGLAVVPMFAGYDLDADDPAKAGRIFSYDVTGGRYEEHSFHSVGSGSVFARGALKKLYRDDFTGDDAVVACIQALVRRRRRRQRHRRTRPHPPHLPGRRQHHQRRLPTPRRRRGRRDHATSRRRAHDRPRRPASAPTRRRNGGDAR